MKNEKTVIEWLNEAKEQGYEWADAAIENCKTYSHFKGNSPAESLSKSLSQSCVWVDTPEKHSFWQAIHDDLQIKGL